MIIKTYKIETTLPVYEPVGIKTIQKKKKNGKWIVKNMKNKY